MGFNSDIWNEVRGEDKEEKPVGGLSGVVEVK